MAALSGTQAQIFDHMPFGLVSAYQWAKDFPSNAVAESAWPSTLHFSQIASTFTDGEILQLARNPTVGYIVSQLLYGNPLPGALANTLEGQVAKAVMQSYADPAWNSSLGDQANKLHMMDLLVNLEFAKDELAAGRMTTDWQSIGPQLWKAYFNDAVANAAMLGLLLCLVHLAPQARLGRAIAYSAIDEGVRVFGDTGIRAMFNDANDIGGIVKLADGSTTIKQAAGALSDILMQYAGQFAFGKVLQSASPAALNGILAVDPGKTVLTVNSVPSSGSLAGWRARACR